MRMNAKVFMLCALAATSCGKQPAPPPAESQAQPPAAVPETAPTAPPLAATSEMAPSAEPTPAAVPVADANAAGLDLARKSGCLACHSIEKKVVGPAWKDVAARYKSDSSAKAALVEKVKKGGKGNWTDVTGGTPMPPYSPRVSDADIEKLVDFVLSL